MSLSKQLRQEKLAAFKDKDIIKNNLLSLVLAALTLKEKEEGRQLTKQEEFAILQKELKQTKESLSLTPVERTDLIAQANRKIEILNSYLPAQLNPEELLAAYQKYIQESGVEPLKKNRGIITKALLELYSGQTDGKSVSALLNEVLQ
ncbi:MAG: GatB/YqeY domain-containing protein [Erysipelotrichaceae bacterium]|jgi:uncharacterized protein YqeY|nr:GatB/YqeY domain-containing protein [Erysipelotrichaceae bacterium]